MTLLKKGDTVLVLKGKDRGKKGKIVELKSKKGMAIVEGVNVYKKHQKPNPNLRKPGGIIDVAMPVDLSNLQFVNPRTNKPDKLGRKLVDGKWVRFSRTTNEIFEA
ncbi:MAG: 50S ribosomal protein L24 [bacterium]|jgi:large subunit ribosomal protein L24